MHFQIEVAAYILHGAGKLKLYLFEVSRVLAN